MNGGSREHLGDEVELHALGLLGRAESERIEAHAAVCLDCLHRLGAAEAALFALDATLPLLEPPSGLAERIAAGAARIVPQPGSSAAPTTDRRIASLLALAATLALAFGLTFAALVRERSHVPALDRVAIATIVHGHFSHASMVVAPDAAPLAAKVLYARAGGWIAILVDHPRAGLAAFATVAGHDVPCGPVRVDGTVGSAFARISGRAERVELREGSRPVATATLVYPKS